MEEKQLEILLRKSWSKETSSDPDNWSKENPAWGQCAVTACIVNDYLGGDVVWANVVLSDGRNISHYFNKVNDFEIDLTRRQFPEGTIVPQGVEKKKQFNSTREYVLSFEVTRERYELLKEQVAKELTPDIHLAAREFERHLFKGIPESYRDPEKREP